MIRSFDIFDTCLTRRVAEPAEVFDLVGRSVGLGPSYRFFRQEAEREAGKRHGDATLAEIHEILSAWLGRGESHREQLISAELEAEARQLIPIPGMLAQIAKTRENGGRIVFLSDMYLPSSFLRERLREHGFYMEGDLLLVSCEIKKSKASGTLYQEARRRLETSTWEHFGNHPHADVKAAIRAGLKGTYCPWGNLTRFEELLLSWTRHHDLCSRFWAGASRYARMNSGATSRNEQVVAEVSAGVAGPLVFIFALWLVERAVSLNLHTLFFLARDGQVFVEAFNAIAACKGIRTRAHYLYASRISLRFPREFPLSDEDAAGVFQGSGKVPVAVVAARLGIPEDLLREWLTADCTHGDMVISPSVPRVRAILASPGIVSELNKVASARSKMLMDYLQQEGFLDAEQPTVVDLGWNGTLQAGLQKALQLSGSKSSVHGLYLGLASFPFPNLTAEAFLYDSRIKGSEFAHWTTSVTEVLCQADHGSVLGFTRNSDGRISPELDQTDADNPLVPDWFGIHRTTIHHFVAETLASMSPPSAAFSYKRLLIQLLEVFWLDPLREEARIWGACRFASHGLATTKVPLAPSPDSVGELLEILGIKRSRNTGTLWREGSAAKLPLKLPFIAKGSRRAKDYLRRRFR
jgi:FMN phosphatase YigB (HAD superfamily)